MLEKYELFYSDIPVPLKPSESECGVLMVMMNPFLDWRKLLGKKMD